MAEFGQRWPDTAVPYTVSLDRSADYGGPIRERVSFRPETYRIFFARYPDGVKASYFSVPREVPQLLHESRPAETGLGRPGGDKVFRHLVLARISKLDSLRLPKEAGIAAVSHRTLVACRCMAVAVPCGCLGADRSTHRYLMDTPSEA